jgi:hypothetical protein
MGVYSDLTGSNKKILKLGLKGWNPTCPLIHTESGSCPTNGNGRSFAANITRFWVTVPALIKPITGSAGFEVHFILPKSTEGCASKMLPTFSVLFLRVS